MPGTHEPPLSLQEPQFRRRQTALPFMCNFTIIRNFKKLWSETKANFRNAFKIASQAPAPYFTQKNPHSQDFQGQRVRGQRESGIVCVL